MITQNCFPDFITVGGAEGGADTGPLEFADGVGMPFESVHIFVNKTLVRFGIKDKFQIICSGKLIFEYFIPRATALGVDIFNSARRYIYCTWNVFNRCDAIITNVQRELLHKTKCG